ncbi:MAG: aldehyde dehydrogenase family protein, partial [Bacillota bacterium]
MSNAFFKVRPPVNEPVKSYGPGSEEKAEVKQRLKEMRQQVIEIPLIIGGKEVKTGNLGEIREPHDRESLLATYHMAGETEVKMAIEAAMEAKAEWDNTPWEHRVAVFLKAAELLTGPWRATMNAATMLGQSKTVYQAEIEAVCELADFLRFNAYYLTEIYREQPDSTLDAWNRMEWRSLEGFIFAVTPFNFTAIAGNLPASPALMGNTVVWKPASSAVFSNYYLMKLLQEAGLPAGVINFIPGPGMVVGDLVLEDPRLAGIHFTGSTAVFQHMWQIIGLNLKHYNVYPRLVGETGGKDFVFAHPTAEVDSLVTALIRGAF